MKPELLIFDLGRVLVDFDFKKAISDLKRYSPLSDEQIQHFFETTPLWDAYERGSVSSEVFFGKLCEGIELKGLSFETFKPLWCDIFTEKKDSVALLAHLRKSYRLAMLSNVNEMHWTFIRDRHDFMQWFEIPIASYAVGLRKPEPAIFHYVLDKAGVPADKAVFTDDLEAHTLAAGALGIRSHVFTTAQQLKTDIKDLL
jgi:putative hydrolase of the HAD superfamily